MKTLNFEIYEETINEIVQYVALSKDFLEKTLIAQNKPQRIPGIYLCQWLDLVVLWVRSSA